MAVTSVGFGKSLLSTNRRPYARHQAVVTAFQWRDFRLESDLMLGPVRLHFRPQSSPTVTFQWLPFGGGVRPKWRGDAFRPPARCTEGWNRCSKIIPKARYRRRKDLVGFVSRNTSVAFHAQPRRATPMQFWSWVSLSHLKVSGWEPALETSVPKISIFF